METPFRKYHRRTTTVVLFAVALTVPWAMGSKRPKAVGMDEQKRATHALNRLSFGPRPGDVESVMRMGVDKWIELQLHPEKIDDSALVSRLAPLRTLGMGTKEIVEDFPDEQLIKQIADGKASLPHDPTKRVVYEAQLQRHEDKLDQKQQAASDSSAILGAGNQSLPAAPNAASATADSTVGASMNKKDMRREEGDRVADGRIQRLLDLPPDERMNEILRMSPADRRALTAENKRAKLEALAEGLDPRQKETVMALSNPEKVVVSELTQGKLLRAIYGERQLDEVMTDFWFNHFNVFLNKGPERYLVTSYERDAIRAHALGKFEDLLVATAKSPAMMFYLDNWLSVGPNSDIALGIPKNKKPYGYGPRPRPKKGKQANGLNENYGRELMELHTLSVDGGYTQKDVTEVAKVFTGWTIEQPRKGGDFHFEPRMHEPGDKIVLGHSIKSNGEKEGMEVLRLLARNPKTARFISQKLAIRFVSDNPPPALVERMAQTFLKKDGDIREVLRTMFRSPEFWSADAYRAKVKTPLEFVVSAVRASGADVEDTRALSGALNNMGMMLYGMQPPTGYSMKADAWVNSSALLDRMNFALRLAAGKIKGVEIDAGALGGDGAAENSQQGLAQLEGSLLAGDISAQTHETISKELEDPKIAQRRPDDPKRPANVAAITGLILGSPEFQRR